MRNAVGLLVMVGLLSGLTGCEDDGGGGAGGGGHDFGPNDPDLYVVMGDSISAGGGFTWPSRLSAMLGKPVANEASGGQHATEGAARVDGVLANYQPGYLLVLYGANDVITGASSSTIVESLRHMVQAAKANQTIPVIATLTPMTEGHSIFDGGVDAVNPEIVQMGQEEGVAIVRLDQAFGDGTAYLEPDGLHPNDAGQQRIAEAFYDAVN